MQFEWDEQKRQATLNERGIDFVDAAMVWDDPMRQERVDNRKHHGEIGAQTIGRVHFGIYSLCIPNEYKTMVKKQFESFPLGRQISAIRQGMKK